MSLSGAEAASRRPGPVLVTGAGGFVGRALGPALEADGHAVRGASRHAAEPAARIDAVGPGTDWSAALDGIDSVVHLAGLAHVPHQANEAARARYRDVNVLGTRRLTDAAMRAGVRRLVFVSSATVLGTDSAGSVWTDDTPPAPDNEYARSKLEAEAALRDAAGGGLEWAVLRPPLMYGPGVKANMRALLRVASLGLPLPLAALRNRRRLLALPNMCAAVALALRHPAAASRTFLVGDEEEVSTPDLLRRLAAALDRPSRLWPCPPPLLRAAAAALRQGPALRRLAGDFRFSDAGFRAACGWRPPLAMDAALRQTAQWYARQRAAAA